MPTNMYDCITFPNKETRLKVKKEYFDTQILTISLSKYSQLNPNVNHIDFEDSPKKVINLHEKVRRFNNNLFNLTTALMLMHNYYCIWKVLTLKEKTLYSLLFRMSARSVCFEICIYENKLRSLYGTIYKKIKNNQDMDLLVQNYLYELSKYVEDENTQFIKNIRDSDTHCDSILDAYTDEIEIVGGKATGTLSYAINNEDLFNKIRIVLENLVNLKDTLQFILDNSKNINL